jgi:hypothetical protein
MDTNIPEKIEALHKEEKDWESSNSEGDKEDSEEDEEYEYEEVEIDETEFNLTGDEIESWIIELTKLKEEKTPIELEVDEETTLKINYEEDSEENNMEEEE